MRKNITSYIWVGLIFDVLFSSVANSQDTNIPEEINYQFASSELNKKALELIKREISEPTYSIFDELLYCGPQLWERFESIPPISSIDKGGIKFRIPKGEIFIEKSGKLIQNEEDFKLIWDQIISDFKGTDYKIRKLTATELHYFWAIIFYNIQEPLFIIENDKYKLALDFSQNKLKLLFIEAV